MSTPKKPRSDSALKTLPPARQAAIAEYGAAHSLEETVAWLKADGLATNKSSLSEFLSWHALQQQLVKNANTVEALLEEYKAANPNCTPEQIQAVGQSFFTALALQQQDPKQWFLTQQLALKRQQLEFDREKFKEALRTKLESAFNELATACKGNAEALQHIKTARELIAKK
jgi:hypothetical protein